jgi:hypothetical protein
MSTRPFTTFRRLVLTGSIAGVTATGAWYGAGLKMKQDNHKVILFSSSIQKKKTFLLLSYANVAFKKKTQKVATATPDEQVTELETYRANLIQKKIMLDKKIEELEIKKRRSEKRRLREMKRVEEERAKKGD